MLLSKWRLNASLSVDTTQEPRSVQGIQLSTDGENAGTWEPRRQDNVQHGEIDLARGRRRLNTVRSPYRPLQGRADPFTYEGDLRNKTRMRCAAVTCQVIARSARAARP